MQRIVDRVYAYPEDHAETIAIFEQVNARLAVKGGENEADEILEDYPNL